MHPGAVRDYTVKINVYMIFNLNIASIFTAKIRFDPYVFSRFCEKFVELLRLFLCLLVGCYIVGAEKLFRTDSAVEQILI